MPIHKKAPVSVSFYTAFDFEGFLVEIQAEDMTPGLAEHLPVRGEVTQSFEIADMPGGWHLVWLDKAFEFNGALQAHLMIAPRWVAKPLTVDVAVPVHVRLVPDVALVELGAPDIDQLPAVGKGFAMLLEEDESED